MTFAVGLKPKKFRPIALSSVFARDPLDFLCYLACDWKNAVPGPAKSFEFVPASPVHPLFCLPLSSLPSLIPWACMDRLPFLLYLTRRPNLS